MTYQVAKLKAPVSLDDGWEQNGWQAIKPIELRHYMGEKPSHFPNVKAKVGYDDAAIYVKFLVDDRFVRAVAKAHQGAVYRDSCVEFFFTPGSDVELGYFNLEMNCGGTMLFHFQRVPRQDMVVLTPHDLEQVSVAHTLPKTVETEIDVPTQWSVAYRIPYDLLKRYFPGEFVTPASGVHWRANFYKCADATSHPHWLTWSPIDLPRPDFHRPQSFGTLTFE